MCVMPLSLCAVRAGVHGGGVGEGVERPSEAGVQRAAHSLQQERQRQRRVSGPAGAPEYRHAAETARFTSAPAYTGHTTTYSPNSTLLKTLETSVTRRGGRPRDGGRECRCGLSLCDSFVFLDGEKEDGVGGCGASS